MNELGKEVVLKKVSPHPLAFASIMILWIYVAAVAGIIWLFMGYFEGLASGIPWLGNYLGPLAPYAIWAALIVIPTLVITLTKVVWKYFVMGVVLGIALPPILYLGLRMPAWYTFPIAIGISGIALLLIERHRRAHKYIITDRRIIFEYNGLFKKTRRDVVYSRISDIILEKGLLGKIFNYGHVIPVSQPGLGLGEDVAALTVGAGAGKGGVGAGVAVTGGRTVKVPRSRSFYMLYGVPHPEEIHNLIITAIKGSEEAPYLKEILEEMKKK